MSKSILVDTTRCIGCGACATACKVVNKLPLAGPGAAKDLPAEPLSENREFSRLHSWLVRPLQCIGLAMLIAAKFITFLQIYTREAITTSTVLPPPHFSLGRFLSITAIAMTTSLLLSFLWTLDDLGMRYSNRKTGEVRMIGKYIGILLPVIFGFYGILNLFESHEQLLAIRYIFQMIVVLYPPFVVMTVLHFLYMEKYESTLLEKLKTASVNVHQ